MANMNNFVTDYHADRPPFIVADSETTPEWASPSSFARNSPTFEMIQKVFDNFESQSVTDFKNKIGLPNSYIIINWFQFSPAPCQRRASEGYRHKVRRLQ